MIANSNEKIFANLLQQIKKVSAHFLRNSILVKIERARTFLSIVPRVCEYLYYIFKFTPLSVNNAYYITWWRNHEHHIAAIRTRILRFIVRATTCRVGRLLLQTVRMCDNLPVYLWQRMQKLTRYINSSFRHYICHAFSWCVNHNFMYKCCDDE